MRPSVGGAGVRVRPLPWVVVHALERFDGRIVSVDPVPDEELLELKRLALADLKRRMVDVVGWEISPDQLAAYRQYMATRSQLARCGKCSAWTLPFVPHDCPARRKPRPLPDFPPPRFVVTPADAHGLHPWPANKLGGSQYKRNGEEVVGA